VTEGSPGQRSPPAVAYWLARPAAGPPVGPTCQLSWPCGKGRCSSRPCVPAHRPQGAAGQRHRTRPSPPRRPCPAPRGRARATHGRGHHPAVGRQRALAGRPARGHAMAGWRGGGAAGSGPGPAPGRWRSTPPGRPTPRPRSRSCWPRPVVPARQSPCAAPAPSPEPGGHTAPDRACADTPVATANAALAVRPSSTPLTWNREIERASNAISPLRLSRA
jgi:hypothetical protein